MVPRITVVGATGKQGGSVVQTFLQHGGYEVRGLTRSTENPKAQALAAQGVEIAQANFDDLDSLVKAFEGSDMIFGMTDFFIHFFTKSAEEAQAIESEQGKKIAQAAARTQGLKSFIWSTLPDTKAISGGTAIVPHFQSKADVDNYIREELADTLLPKTTFLYLASFIDNFYYPPFQPIYAGAIDKYVYIQPQDKATLTPLLGDAQVNTGPYVLAIVKHADLTKGGKTVLASLGFETYEDVSKSLSKHLEKELVFAKVDFPTYESIFPKWGAELGLNMLYFERCPGESGWGSSGNTGVKPLLLQDLGLTIGKEIETWESGMQRMDWKTKFGPYAQK
ncbi:hscarg dehydrogenase protein [Penicillium chermesinum]|uniref:Hscarg dehydrogenase protein n=1 Tax=Penicillium chermesinum TaxID=63820 RepID=A0A9W9TRR4_9EURO|nr:hscarg dehydrogenase protein [Penicillium chermesinum]KAJ5238960.1 hscarg dehydrogenase protein [Penicillium chermesinum]